MHKGIRSTWSCITDEMIEAVSHEKLNGRPFAVHTALSAPGHAGIAVILELIQANRSALDNDETPFLDEYQECVLLTLIRVVSSLMQDNAENISSWAAGRYKEAGDD